MSKFSIFFFSLTLAAPLAAVPCTGSWDGTTSNWNTSSNWNPPTCYPSQVNDTATFLTSGVTGVSLSAPINLLSLTLSNPSQNFTISAASLTLDKMAFYASTSTPIVNPSFNVLGGSQTLNHVIVEFENDFSIDIESDLTLNIAEFVNYNNPSGLRLSGNGTLTLDQSAIDGISNLTQQNLTINNNNSSNFGFLFSEYTIESGSINNNGSAMGAYNDLFTIQDGTFSNTYVNNSSVLGYQITTFTIENGSFLNSHSLIGYQPSTAGTMTINGGTFSNTNSGIISYQMRDFIIAGGEITNTSSFIGINNTSIEFIAGTLINDQSSQFGTLSGSMVMTGGTIINQNGSSINPAIVTINGGNITQTSSSQFFPATSLTINSGLVTSDHSNLLTNLVNLQGGSLIFTNSSMANILNLNISGGKLLLDDSSLNVTSSLTMTGGLLIADNSSVVNGGTLTVNGGTLKNNALVQAPTTVNGQGIVTGTGSFNSSFVNNGTVIPGDRPGQLQFNSFTQTPNGELKINILDNTVYGSIKSLTTATLDGKLVLEPYGHFKFVPGVPLTIVQANDGVTGTFSKIVDLLPLTVNAEISYFPGKVVVELFPNFDSFVSFKEIAFSNINQINLLLINHMDRMIDPCACPTATFQAYLDPLGSIGQVHSSNDMTRVNYNTAGFLTGFDLLYDTYGFGIAFDFESLRAFAAQDFGKFKTYKYHFQGYGTWRPTPCLTLNALAGGGWENIFLNRTAGFFLGDEATSRINGRLFDALASVEYLFHLRMLHFIPLAGLQYINYHLDQFEESGVFGFNHKFNHQNYDSLRSLLGFKVNASFCIDSFKLIPQLNVIWQSEFLDHQKDLEAFGVDFTHAPSVLSLPGSGRNSILAGCDLAFVFDRYTLDAIYEFEGNKRYHNHFFTLELAASF